MEFENTAALLGDKILVTEPILKKIKDEVDEYFKDKNYTQNQYNQFTIAALSLKILDQEIDINNLKRQIK